jgi:hypothetical protein
MPVRLLTALSPARRAARAARGRMTHLTALLAGTLLTGAAVLAIAGPSNGGSVSYRWVDENGVVHYGDRVPPQYSQKETSVINSQGVEVERREAPKSGAEAEEAARKQKVELQQKQHDAFLLTTYTSVKDIEQLRDERLEQLKTQRRAAEQYVASLHDRLLVLQARVMHFKPYNADAGAHRMPDDLAEDLEHALNEMRVQRNALALKDQEEAATRAQFQSDIDRYRQLHSAAVSTAAR